MECFFVFKYEAILFTGCFIEASILKYYSVVKFQFMG
nr:MAG TPA: hypothetical protein [Caudoviricetes sp.]